MTRACIRVVVVAVLVAAGWIAGRAQSGEPDFEIVVTAPAGETTIECVRGCTLAWVERGVNPRSVPTSTFTFECSGTDAALSRCSSGRVGGWQRR